jgi:hypothetical protein
MNAWCWILGQAGFRMASRLVFVAGFAAITVLLEVFMRYSRYVTH